MFIFYIVNSCALVIIQLVNCSSLIGTFISVFSFMLLLFAASKVVLYGQSLTFLK